MTLLHTSREAVHEDTQAISTLIIAGSADGTGVEGTPEELNNWRMANASFSKIQSRIDDPNSKLLVEVPFENSTTLGLLGTAYISVAPDHQAYLGGVYCAVRGQGVGLSLCESLLEWAAEREVHSVEMTIARRNIGMQRLASKLGFELRDEFTNDDFYKSGTFGRWFL